MEDGVKSVVVCPQPWTAVQMRSLTAGAERSVQRGSVVSAHQTLVVLTRVVWVDSIPRGSSGHNHTICA